MTFERVSFKTNSLLKKTMENYNRQALEAGKEGIPVAWVTAVFPVEILYAMDIFPYYAENFGAAAGTHRRTEQLSKIAEQKGYSLHSCAYTRAGLGLMYSSPDFNKEIPMPYMLLATNIQCAPLQKWFEITGKYFNRPVFLLDSPQIDESIWQIQQNYFVEQLTELIQFLEKSTGKKLNMNRLRETLLLSSQASDLWRRILAYAKTKPARLTYWDSCVLMGPIVTLRGTQAAVDYYTEVLKELEDRDKHNVAAVAGEKFRLYWDHIPIWPRLRYFSDFFGSHHIAVVSSVYTHTWAKQFDPERPLETLASNYMTEFVNQRFERRVEIKMNLMREFQADGFIFCLNNSCKPNTLALMDKKKAISERLKIPGLILEADMCDPRFFVEGHIRNKLETFIETALYQA